MLEAAKFRLVIGVLFLLLSPYTHSANTKTYPNLGLIEIQGMDVYAEHENLHALLVGKPLNAKTLGVFHVVSKDGGGTWGKPSQVQDGQVRRVMSRRGNDAQVAAAGKRVVVAFRQVGEIPESGPLVMAYSSDGGRTWGRGENPAVGDQTQNQAYVDLVADKSGHFHVVWLDDREENGNSQGLRYARSVDGGKHWQGDVTLDGTACTCCWNRLAVLPDQSVAALYRDDDPHDMRLALRSPKHGTWRNVGAVGAFDWRFSGCPHCGGGIAASPGRQGLIHGVVWSGKEGAAGLYYLNSADQGGHWSQPQRIADGQSKESDIAVLADGRVGVVYAGPTGKGEGIMFTETQDQGLHWTAPVLLSAAEGLADHPRIVSTRKGFRVFWTEKRDGGGKAWAMYLVDRPL